MDIPSSFLLSPPPKGNNSGGFLIANYAGKKCTAPCLQRVSMELVLIVRANGVTWKYRTLLARCEYGVCTHCKGQWSNVKVPHLACKVWVRSLFLLKRWGCVKYRINTDLFLSSQPMITNSLLTPCKQGAVLSRYPMALAMSTGFVLIGYI